MTPRTLRRTTGACLATLLVLAGCGGDAGGAKADAGPVTTFKISSRNHVTSAVDYAQTPPAGGDHNPVWQNCGVYRTAVANENAVHSLEHGAVWLTYQPALAAGEITRLESYATNQTHLLVSPYPGLPVPIVAIAWGVQRRFNSAADPGIAAFIKAYELGPQAPEPGALCARGLGEPL